MAIIKHKFRDHKINPLTEILIIGTFNPDAKKNDANFFYSRDRNFLWRLLPTAYGENDLKGTGQQEKIDFIRKKKVDFIDLISEVDVDEGKETDYKDGYIDKRIEKWNDIIAEIDKLKNLKRICFTRKTFSGIPKMKEKIEAIRKHCHDLNIPFELLKTPARIYSVDKQKIWTDFFLVITDSYTNTFSSCLGNALIGLSNCREPKMQSSYRFT